MIINIFDFDKTLFLTPDDSVENRELYKIKTGVEYPHKGWYSKHETLDDTIFDISVNHDISVLAKKSIESNYMTFLLTGRIHKLHKHVKQLCVKHDILFDRYYCSHGSPNTLEYKKKVLSNIQQEFGNLCIVNFYDDRVEHTEELTLHGKNIFQNFNYVLVV